MAALRLKANAFVRAAPSARGEPLGLARKGSVLMRIEKTAPDGWLAVDWRGGVGWVWGRMVEN